MCLIVFSLDYSRPYKLVLAANRDEYFTRPTASAGFWDDSPTILAGRDLDAGGTWLGVSRAGRIAAITNFRDPSWQVQSPRSRGKLVAEYLHGEQSAADFKATLHATVNRYEGFNLIFGDLKGLHYFSNHGPLSTRIPAGIHGLSNHLLDSPWPKVTAAKEKMATLLNADNPEPGAYFTAMADHELFADHLLPNTGVGLERERQLSPLFITGNTYGTRSTTLIFIDQSNTITFIERTYHHNQAAVETRRFILNAGL
jgi:uncharacterized protein with NRDE domain